MNFGAIKKLLAGMVFVLASGSSYAGIYYFDNGGPDGAAGGLINNTAVTADDFTVVGQPVVLDTLTFWTLEQAGAHDGTVIYTIYNDVGGVPGTTGADVVASVYNPIYTKTLLGVGDYEEYRYTVDLSAAPLLTSGHYWLALNLESFGDANPLMIFWENTAAGVGDPAHVISLANYAAGWFSLGVEQAFALQGKMLPIPPAVFLMGIGLGVLGFFARKTRAQA